MFDRTKYRLDSIDFSHSEFYREDGFDIHLTVSFNSIFKKKYGVGNGFVMVSCDASGDINSIEYKDAYGKLDDVELTLEEKQDVLYFLAKHSIVEEEKEQNEFPIGV